MQFAKMDSLRTWTAVGLCFSFAWLHSLVLMARADTVYNGGTCSGILDGKSAGLCTCGSTKQAVSKLAQAKPKFAMGVLKASPQLCSVLY